jgi:beta-glucosidase/6-phospho-beta-glucosidase/beta-galactosidase
VSRPLFKSFFMGGFECSTHRIGSGRRLDLIAATQHDMFAEADYARCRAAGIYTVREGLRWHLIETAPGVYDFRSAEPLLRAAQQGGMQVVWDLCHYGWPDDIDIFSDNFIRRFAAFSRAFAGYLKSESDDTPFIAPINEISFLTWAAGAVGCFYPFAQNRGSELKRRLARAAVEGIEAFWSVWPGARIVHPDPLIHVVGASDRDEDVARAERDSMWESWDMIAGRRDAWVGGDPKYLDIVGLNYYPHNQWATDGETREMISRDHPEYAPLRNLIAAVYERYGRPLLISETGTEDERRAPWLRYVAEEVRAARAMGVPLEGLCLYPIVNHPGWDDDRHCHNGLWDYPGEAGERAIYAPLAEELSLQRTLTA